jgi:hypothetical protein
MHFNTWISVIITGPVVWWLLTLHVSRSVTLYCNRYVVALYLSQLHCWFLSCSCLFHSVYTVLILNCTPVLAFSCKSCMWCLLLSGLLVCCDSFFLVLYPFCFLHCTSAAAVLVFQRLFLHTICAAILKLQLDMFVYLHFNWQETQNRDQSTTEIHLHNLFFGCPSANFLKKHDLSEYGSPFSGKEANILVCPLNRWARIAQSV